MLPSLIVAVVVLLDFCTSLLMPRRPPKILAYGPSDARHVCWVFPGFSNPPDLFGQGMSAVLGDDKLILVVDCGTSVDDDQIYNALWQYMEFYVGPAEEITLYGHSMGGQIGMLFRQRYLRESGKFGPVRTTVLDCSPMRPNSLAAAAFAPIARLLVKLLWPGVILRGLIYLGNLLSRKTMPIHHDDATDHKLYKRYARGLALFNTRAWRAQLLYMLGFKAARIEAEEAEIFYIGSNKPKLDKLVRQSLSISQWRQKFPNLVLTGADVSHAWPLEKPGAYRGIFQMIWKTPR